MKKLTLSIFMIITMLFAACSNDDNENENGEGEEQAQQQEDAAQQQPQEPEPVEFSDDEFVDSDEGVVVVNGEELQGDDYNTAYSLVKSMMHQAGQDVSDLEALQDETINFLVEQELVMQEANDEGVEVTDEEVQEEIDTLKANGEEQYQASLEQLNLNEEQFEQQLRYNLATVHYMEEAFDTEATDEEVEEMYDELSAQMGDQQMQDLDEMRDQLEQMVEQNKQQEAYADKVDELRESADVEELL
ncbi:SurA N-terminal domain-containing protein [Oceanobacillus jeddahense]|uniref:SurA N-terminal domain-containing protein n=1 Tax=Oceanobacillus jeddahense TaxID=1462527 RepID=A0ABY5JXC8_9BACI|nr:SurA N-terminal domain-containing protein [Oceanobacillus jeddahense]UUI04092.1 SurA N-terminal domain-containing protein [Oceanobacillus jeddahense]